MTHDQIQNEIRIIETLLPNSEGELWTQRNDRLTELRKLDQPQHQFTSSLYREKVEHELEQHPMEQALFRFKGIY